MYLILYLVFQLIIINTNNYIHIFKEYFPVTLFPVSFFPDFFPVALFPSFPRLPSENLPGALTYISLD